MLVSIMDIFRCKMLMHALHAGASGTFVANAWVDVLHDLIPVLIDPPFQLELFRVRQTQSGIEMLITVLSKFTSQCY